MRGRSNWTYWEGFVLALLIFGAIGALSVYSNRRLDRLRRERERSGVFVIGDVVSENNNLKGALIVDYRYTFAGREYLNSSATDRWLFPPVGHVRRFERFFAAYAICAA